MCPQTFLKRIRRACGRHERLQAERLDGRRPTYKLDHLIRERYPTFVDALRELDDALCLVFLFATLSPSKFVPAARVATCARLRTEFLAYVARTNSLRATFISIKGIYYQAEVHGVTLTWIEPHHSFAQQPTMSVDYRVMLSFLELYEAVLTFVNFKLYHDLQLAYPPLIDSEAQKAGLHISAVVLAKANPKAELAATVASSAASASAAASAAASTAASTALSAKQLADLRGKLSRVDGSAEAADADAAHDEDEQLQQAAAGGQAGSGLEELDSPDVVALRTLFASCHVFCRRYAAATPRTQACALSAQACAPFCPGELRSGA